jgi:hypothetical protein
MGIFSFIQCLTQFLQCSFFRNCLPTAADHQWFTDHTLRNTDIHSLWLLQLYSAKRRAKFRNAEYVHELCTSQHEPSLHTIPQLTLQQNMRANSEGYVPHPQVKVSNNTSLLDNIRLSFSHTFSLAHKTHHKDAWYQINSYTQSVVLDLHF